MAANGYSSIRVYPLAGLVPSVTIVICALALNLVGNGMRDAFDTREKVI
jgi:ABC-type dipeptide/oligopeptide/nickel transport system permease subunit